METLFVTESRELLFTGTEDIDVRPLHSPVLHYEGDSREWHCARRTRPRRPPRSRPVSAFRPVVATVSEITLDGEEVLDNQDLCLLLKVGIRTLQRYRAIGVLPYFTISGKVFYRTKDVHEFIRTRFADVEERAAKRKEKEARKEERRRKRGLFP